MIYHLLSMNKKCVRNILYYDIYADSSRIHVDMKRTSKQQHCFAYAFPQCRFNINDIEELSFEMNMRTECMKQKTWACPLEASPPQRRPFYSDSHNSSPRAPMIANPI